MNNLNELITSIVSITGVSAVLIYIGKLIIEKSLDVGVDKYKLLLDKDLESHKNNLEIQVEHLKSNLTLIQLEHEIRFNRLHQDRADAIKNVYLSLTDHQNKLKNYTTFHQGKDWNSNLERRELAKQSWITFNEEFKKYKLYFSKDMSNQIQGFLKMSWDTFLDMWVAQDSYTDFSSGSEKAEARNMWRDANKKVEIELARSLEIMEDEFRILIGVS